MSLHNRKTKSGTLKDIEEISIESSSFAENAGPRTIIIEARKDACTFLALLHTPSL